MKMHFTRIVLSAVVLGCLSPLHARPLLTEDAVTAGKLSFDANILMGLREDRFGTPEIEYTTVRFPWQARLGLNPRLDFGIMFDYVSQHLEQNGAKYTGSTNELFSTFIKYTPWDHKGFMLFWHTRRSAQDGQELPIARGDDIEALFLYSIPTRMPLSFNAGYIHRDPYSNKFGIETGQPTRVRPGSIVELKASMQTPLPANFSILSELAYYNIQKSKLADTEIQDSAGEAMDALIGLSWDYQGWYLSAGAEFGLLDEQHTSFDIQRGAGDVTYLMRVGYKLLPHKPLQ